MSDISVIGNAVVESVQSAAKTIPAEQTTSVEVETTTKESVATAADRVEFSQQALMLEKIHQLPSVRQERIDAIKEAILNDSYLTTDKLDIAFNRLIDEVAE